MVQNLMLKNVKFSRSELMLQNNQEVDFKQSRIINQESISRFFK